MKSQRHELILRLVQEEVIDTQETLQKVLELHGLKVTQATLSRDIKELALIKVPYEKGSRYSVPKLNTDKLKKDGNSFYSLVSDAVVSVDYALNTAVIRCHTGMAQAVCAKLDSAALENVVGTIAGDDTIFILMRTEKDADVLVRELRSIISQ